MVNGWAGVDPTQQDDGGTSYELGAYGVVNDDLTLTRVRVWHGASSNNVANRKARIWTGAGVLLDTIAIDASLPAGWNVYDLTAPIELTAGSEFVVSYTTTRYYGAVVAGLPADSSDDLITYTGGRFTETLAGTFPSTSTTAFYGIDVEYTPGIGGNVAPDITVAVTTAQLVATATVTVDDESPGSVTYLYLWGDGASSSSGSTTANHTYAAAGVYALMVVATDSGGLKGYAAAVVIVRSDSELFDPTLIVPELAARLATLATLNKVSSYGPGGDPVQVPHGIVGLPDQEITYHESYSSGGPSAMATFPVVILLGRAHAVEAYEALARFLRAGGVDSIRATIESGVYVHCDDPTVVRGRIDELPVAGTSYLAVVFDVELAR
ncbi:MAG TPA: DUF4082 domain-containing protein [Actinoplanes sp.]|jgi:hypothetical protein|nr:DUF4082 domain-containing protein [Actinoplanes sp.]